MSVWRSFLRFFGRRDPVPEPAPSPPVGGGPYRDAAVREEEDNGPCGPWSDSSPEAVMSCARPASSRRSLRSYVGAWPGNDPAPDMPPAPSYSEPNQTTPDDGFGRLVLALADATEDLDNTGAAIDLDAELTHDAMIDAGMIAPAYAAPRNAEEAEERAIMRALSVEGDDE